MHNVQIQEWDSELFNISSELESIVKAKKAKFQKSQEVQSILNLKLQIFQIQALIAKKLDMINTLSARRTRLPAIQRSLLHWCGIFVEQVKAYYRGKTDLLGKMMWFSLTKVRLSAGKGAKDLRVTDEDILQMSIKQKDLLQTEQYLSNYLLKLKIKKDELHKQYEDLSSAQSNKEAAGMLYAQYGRNPKEAFKHPTLTALQQSILQLTKPLHPLPDKYEDVIEKEAWITSETAISECRDYIIRKMRYPHSEDTSFSQVKLNDSLEKIEELENRISNAKLLKNRNLPHFPHPKIRGRKIFKHRKNF